MLKTIPDILAQIVERKKQELERCGDGLAGRAVEAIATRRDFQRALSERRPAVIAEIKKASPSKGVLAGEFNPVSLARAYEDGGAMALSVLTDKQYFQGSLLDLEDARGATGLPVLRKDFTIDPRQVMEAAAHGADAILLIAAILSEREMRDFRELGETYRMSSLVEVHDADELQRAVDSGARMIGVNNRDLHTFEVKLETSLELAERIPSGVIRVAESGIHSAEDVGRLRAAGYDAFLVGEHLMRSGQPAEALRALLA